MGSSQLLTAFFKSKITRSAIGLGIAATTANSSLYTVNTGQRAVIFDRCRGSLLDETVGEGTHFLIPWIQKPYIFDIRPRPHTFSSISAGTRDLHVLAVERKKLLEAKRIAEENERKWILASRKAEEEKRAREKLEQDKERIEADKKLLEAKQIAEENERKRILSSQKAGEEEKRAILKKIEQGKGVELISKYLL